MKKVYLSYRKVKPIKKDFHTGNKSLRRLEGIKISEKNQTFVFHYKFYLFPFVVVTLSYGTKIIQNNQFVLAPDDFQNVYIIEKVPNYLPLVEKCHFLALKLKYLFQLIGDLSFLI